MALVVDDHTHVLVLTGAGISAESGIPTFRAAGGLWEEHPVEQVASPQGFARDPALVWRFYSERRRGVAKAEPNAGHETLVRLEALLAGRFLLVTQNVDGLHHRAGSTRLLEIHGALNKSRCTLCDREPFIDTSLYLDKLPMCARCDAGGRPALLRPHIVWFGEMLDASHLQAIDDFMAKAQDQLLFLAVGTSGAVYPAAGLVHAAHQHGGRTALVNLDEADNATSFDSCYRGKAGDVLPELFSDLW